MSDRNPVIPEASRGNYDNFHFAPAFKVGNTVYVSGVIGTGPDGSVPDAVDEELTLAFAALKATLEEAGASMADVVDMTSFHTDMPASLGKFLKAKDVVVGEPYPAWTAIGCTALAIPGARVEIKATAVIPG